MPVVELDPRTGYDFLTSACTDCGELEDLLAEDRRWLEESRAALKAAVGEDLCVDACTGFVPEIGRMLVGRPEIRTARDVVAAIDALPDEELTEVMVGELLEDAELGAITRRAVDGDTEAFGTSRPGSSRRKGHAVLTATHHRPGPGSPAHRPLLAAALRDDRGPHRPDARARRRRLAVGDDIAGDPIGFIERATTGIRVVPEQRIRRIVLAPSYFGRPYNSLTKVGDVQLICYPIADSSLGSADRLTPPNSTVRLYRALGDESRLRILQAAGGARPLPDGDRQRARTEQADDQAPPGRAPKRRPGHDHRAGQHDLLQPSPRPRRRGRPRASRLPGALIPEDRDAVTSRASG